MQARPGIELAFTDAARRHWIRRAAGELIQIADDPNRYYHVERPLPSYAALVPVN